MRESAVFLPGRGRGQARELEPEPEPELEGPRWTVKRFQQARRGYLQNEGSRLAAWAQGWKPLAPLPESLGPMPRRSARFCK